MGLLSYTFEVFGRLSRVADVMAASYRLLSVSCGASRACSHVYRPHNPPILEALLFVSFFKIYPHGPLNHLFSNSLLGVHDRGKYIDCKSRNPSEYIAVADSPGGLHLATYGPRNGLVVSISNWWFFAQIATCSDLCLLGSSQSRNDPQTRLIRFCVPKDLCPFF